MEPENRILNTLIEAANETGISIGFEQVQRVLMMTGVKAKGRYEYLSAPYLELLKDEYRAVMRSMVFDGSPRKAKA